MVYWHLENDSDLAQFEDFRLKRQALETAHLKLRTELRDAEAAWRADPGKAELRDRVKDLQKQLEEIERRAPWLTAEAPVELTLWGTTHGLI